ncbi:hypothetical protein ACFXP3_02630 [Streptomyces sp. NPDC059096]|uniref:hypothetical protein n=1 Tax=Streptomyces sp. NPDC059096 TaxID=3346727 RepID=UPI0036CE573D
MKITLSRQDEQGSQEAGVAGGPGAELGDDPPVLKVGEAVLDRCTSHGEDAVGLLDEAHEPQAGM